MGLFGRKKKGPKRYKIGPQIKADTALIEKEEAKARAKARKKTKPVKKATPAKKKTPKAVPMAARMKSILDTIDGKD